MDCDYELSAVAPQGGYTQGFGGTARPPNLDGIQVDPDIVRDHGSGVNGSR
jgi:hypothetical protein